MFSSLDWTTGNLLKFSLSNNFLYRATIDETNKIMLASLFAVHLGPMSPVAESLVRVFPHQHEVTYRWAYFFLLPSFLACRAHDSLLSSRWTSAKPCCDLRLERCVWWDVSILNCDSKSLHVKSYEKVKCNVQNLECCSPKTNFLKWHALLSLINAFSKLGKEIKCFHRFASNKWNNPIVGNISIIIRMIITM